MKEDGKAGFCHDGAKLASTGRVWRDAGGMVGDIPKGRVSDVQFLGKPDFGTQGHAHDIRARGAEEADFRCRL